MQVVGAVDIGGTKIAVGLVAPDGRILTREVGPSFPEKGVEDGLARIAGMLDTCLASLPDVCLVGIGIGCTGPVNPQTGVLGPNSFLPDWEGLPITDRLSAMAGVPAAIENDADAAALGEAAWGSAQGAASCIYVTVSTGIGCGVILNGSLYRGVDGAHPEIGHHVIDWSAGTGCFCGAQGCWESLASGTALAAWYRQQKQSEDCDEPVVDARAICRRAEQGEALALAAVQREGCYLGLGLSNLIGAYVPQVIVLGGGVMESWPLFADQVRAVIRSNCGLVPYQKTDLRLASLGARTGLAGAARVWYHRFLSSNCHSHSTKE